MYIIEIVEKNYDDIIVHNGYYNTKYIHGLIDDATIYDCDSKNEALITIDELKEVNMNSDYDFILIDLNEGSIIDDMKELYKVCIYLQHYDTLMCGCEMCKYCRNTTYYDLLLFKIKHKYKFD